MLEPSVRQMIVCDDARVSHGTRGKIDIFGLLNKALAEDFPFNLTFAVYLCLTNGRGSGSARVVVKFSEDESVVYDGTSHAFSFGDNPLALHPFLIRVFSCQIPGPGLYSVEFVYNESTLASCPMLVEKSK